jgi:hypothetical protein
LDILEPHPHDRTADFGSAVHRGADPVMHHAAIAEVITPSVG